MSARSFPDFNPRAPWLGADLQTLRNVLRGPALAPPVDTRAIRLALPLADGSGDQLAARLFEPESDRLRDGAPLVVLVHGLGGTEDSTYVQVTTRHLISIGYPTLQLSLRGAGASRPLCRGQYHAGRTSDLRDALAEISSGIGPVAEYSGNGFVAVGYSLGGNMLLKFAAEHGGLRGAVSVSAPIDLSSASHRFLDARNRFYHRYLLGHMKDEALTASEGLSKEERMLIPRLQSILEFDDRFVAPRNGFTDAEDYYLRNSALHFMGEIDLPTLVIHARDDPWIPSRTYTEFPWHENPRLEPLLPRSGGHVGFHARGSRVPWHDQCIEVFLQGV